MLSFQEFKAEIEWRKQPNIKKKLESKKRQAAVLGLENICENLTQVLEHGHAISEVLIVLGSTPVSPKELYRIKLPVGVYDGLVSNFINSKSKLFRKLVTSDLFDDVKELTCSVNVMVLVRAPRECNFGSVKMLPKPAFKIPKRGTHFVITLKSKGRLINEELSRMGDSEFEVSGVESLLDQSDMENAYLVNTPSCHDSSMHNGITTNAAVYNNHKVSQGGSIGPLLSTSCCQMSLDDGSEQSQSSDNGNTSFNNGSSFEGDLESEETLDSQLVIDESKKDYLWFMLPGVMKGYKNK